MAASATIIAVWQVDKPDPFFPGFLTSIRAVMESQWNDHHGDLGHWLEAALSMYFAGP